MGFRDTGVAHGEFHDTDDDDLFLGVHRWDPPQGPFTYGMLHDTLVGMDAYLQGFSHSPLEYEVFIYQGTGTRPDYLTGYGFFTTLTDPGEHSDLSMPRNGTSEGLRMLGASHGTLNSS